MAPIAIAAVAVASYVIVHRAVAGKHTTASLSIVSTTTSDSPRNTHKVSKQAKFYRVQANDTLSKISAKTGVSLTTLEALNPHVNPQALQPGKPLRLRR